MRWGGQDLQPTSILGKERSFWGVGNNDENFFGSYSSDNGVVMTLAI